MSFNDRDEDRLALMPPHRRAVVRRRLEVIRRHEAGEIDGRTAAAELGIAPSTFGRLAQAWSRIAIQGPSESNELRTRSRRRLSEAQQGLIDEMAATMPTAANERIARAALREAAHRGVAMPHHASIEAYVGELKIGRLPGASPFGVADLVIEHAVVDIPVEAIDRPGAFMPLATVVVAIDPPAIVGLSLQRDEPSSRPTAQALLEALSSARFLSPVVNRRIFLDIPPDGSWNAFLSALRSAGLDAVIRESERLRPPSVLPALMGLRFEGLRIMPRLGRRPFLGRLASLPSGAVPLSLGEAETYLRARWVVADGVEATEEPGSVHSLAALAAFLSDRMTSERRRE